MGFVASLPSLYDVALVFAWHSPLSRRNDLYRVRHKVLLWLYKGSLYLFGVIVASNCHINDCERIEFSFGMSEALL